MRGRERRAERVRILAAAQRDVIRRWSAGELTSSIARAMLDALDGHMRDAGAAVPPRPLELRTGHGS